MSENVEINNVLCKREHVGRLVGTELRNIECLFCDLFDDINKVAKDKAMCDLIS